MSKLLPYLNSLKCYSLRDIWLPLMRCIKHVEMSTQTAIAEKIREKGADYILAVKDNQKELHAQVKDEFRFANSSVVSTENIDFGHGRIDHEVAP